MTRQFDFIKGLANDVAKSPVCTRQRGSCGGEVSWCFHVLLKRDIERFD